MFYHSSVVSDFEFYIVERCSNLYVSGLWTMNSEVVHLWWCLDAGESHSSVVELTPNRTSYVVHRLIESMVYMFSVRARTSVDWGKPTYGNVTVGPCDGLCSLCCSVIIIVPVGLDRTTAGSWQAGIQVSQLTKDSWSSSVTSSSDYYQWRHIYRKL